MPHPLKGLPARLSNPSAVHHNDRNLTYMFNPTSLEIRNDSWGHRRHYALRQIGGGDGETRMSLLIAEQRLCIWELRAHLEKILPSK